MILIRAVCTVGRCMHVCACVWMGERENVKEIKWEREKWFELVFFPVIWIGYFPFIRPYDKCHGIVHGTQILKRILRKIQRRMPCPGIIVFGFKSKHKYTLRLFLDLMTTPITRVWVKAKGGCRQCWWWWNGMYLKTFFSLNIWLYYSANHIHQIVHTLTFYWV